MGAMKRATACWTAPALWRFSMVSERRKAPEYWRSPRPCGASDDSLDLPETHPLGRVGLIEYLNRCGGAEIGILPGAQHPNDLFVGREFHRLHRRVRPVQFPAPCVEPIVHKRVAVRQSPRHLQAGELVIRR